VSSVVSRHEGRLPTCSIACSSAMRESDTKRPPCASTSQVALPSTANLTSLSSFLDDSLALPSGGSTAGSSRGRGRPVQNVADDEVTIEFETPDLRSAGSYHRPQGERNAAFSRTSQASSSRSYSRLTADEANDLRIRFNMKAASISGRDDASSFGSGGGSVYLDKEDFFELMQELHEEGRLDALPPLREQAQLFMELDKDDNGYLDFEELSYLYTKVRDGVMPKSAGVGARMKKSFFRMSGYGPKVTSNYDDMPADERLEQKFGIDYIFLDPPGMDHSLAVLKNYFIQGAKSFSTHRRKVKVSMTRSECLELLPRMLDGKERYDGTKCNGGYHELPWGPCVIDLKRLAAAFDRKDRRPDLSEGSIVFGDFVELYVESHLGRYDSFFETAPRSSSGTGDQHTAAVEVPSDGDGGKRADDSDVVVAAAAALSRLDVGLDSADASRTSPLPAAGGDGDDDGERPDEAKTGHI
jgi:hypothetical protein